MSDPFTEEFVDPCVGWVKHAWRLTIEEGQVTLMTEPCGPECRTASEGLGDMKEWLAMSGEIPVAVRMATDCPAYDVDEHGCVVGKPHRMAGYENGSHYITHGSRCDCNWWPVLVPVSETPGEEKP